MSDGSVKLGGLAGTPYSLCDGDVKLCGVFNAKLKKHQVNWLPCEVEALAIGSAVKHFATFIIQSQSTTQVLTDSKPCVQAYDKLRRGQFSASSRVTSFLSTVSKYQADVRHISGAAYVPTDFSSRNPVQCSDHSGQVRKFVHQSEESVVRTLSVKDGIEGSKRMTFARHNMDCYTAEMH